MFRTILIANRGEIACRVIETAQRLGIKTVAVFSDADRHARHVRLADFAEHIGPSPSQKSYLNVDALINAAIKHGAEAIHPGYGFLSENQAFSKACADAGIVFIGPSADAIVSMADKSLAKDTMKKAGVPVVPGFYSEQSADWQKEADNIGYPLLIKAVSGGGGRGMRLVQKSAEFNEAFAAAQREAKSYFDDERVFLEKYIADPRHIEIQIFSDSNNDCVYLFERDCSIQRRHQKIIEEAPATHFSDALRKEMGETAVKAAQSISYLGAGTIEFLLDVHGNFYFMEMNTRLQVEHPVTELITGLDLVEWQFLVASGTKLPLKQDEIRIHGHAIETRIYAEDPAKNFMPSVGELSHVHFLIDPAIRVDNGYESGDHISMHYDPMIAKIISYGKTREVAREKLIDALSQTEIVGVTTNIDMLKEILSSSAFIDAEISTHFLQTHEELLEPSSVPPIPLEIVISAFALQCYQNQENQALIECSDDITSPWTTPDSWRMNIASRRKNTLWWNESQYDIASENHVFYFQNQEYAIDGALNGHDLEVILDQQLIDARVVFWNNQCHFYYNNQHCVFHYGHSRAQDTQSQEAAGHIVSPMPGTVVEVFVSDGDEVNIGDKLLIIEAMKMEHTLTAHSSGTVENLVVKQGDSVNEGLELLNIVP